MLAIGFQIGSTTSPDSKQYTAVLLDNGTLITNYGKRYGTLTLKSALGSTKTKKLATVALGMAELKKLYNTKRVNPDYDQLIISFQSTDFSHFVKGIAMPDSYSIVEEYRRVAHTERKDVTPKKHAIGSSRVADSPRIVEGIKDFFDGNVSILSMRLNGATPTLPKIKVAVVAEPIPAAELRFTKVEAKVIRPNGEQYRPRQIMGHTDVSLLREFRKNGVYVRLAGPPGGGKTALAEAAFKDLITVNGHGDMTVANFVGSYLPDPANGNSWVWHNGPLVRAMELGVPLFVDEGTRIPTEVLNIMFSVMDGRKTLNIDDRPDLPAIKAAKGFYVIMGYNPETLGARALDEALISRFRVQIDVHTDHNTAKALGVPAVAVRIAKNLETRDRQDRSTGGPGFWVPQMRELLTYRDLIKMNVGQEFALATLVAACPRAQDIPEVIRVIKDVAKQDVALPILGGLV